MKVSRRHNPKRIEHIIIFVGFCFPVFLGVAIYILFGISDTHYGYEDESRSTITFTSYFGVHKGTRVLTRSHMIFGLLDIYIYMYVCM